MNKVYKKIIVYRPSTNEVQYLKKIPYEIAISGNASDLQFKQAYDTMDKVRDVVIGITIGGDMYQLSPAVYGSYIKESDQAMRLFNKSRILVAVADYQKENHIPFD